MKIAVIGSGFYGCAVAIILSKKIRWISMKKNLIFLMELHLATNLDIILATIIQDLKKLLMRLRNLKKILCHSLLKMFSKKQLIIIR